MEFSRRDFVATGLAGAAGVLAPRSLTSDLAAAPLQMPDEDGYKLWLRFAPPGAIAARYRQALRQVVVEGSSPTAGIIRDELTAGTAAMFGSRGAGRAAGRGGGRARGRNARELGGDSRPRLAGRADQARPGRLSHSRRRGSATGRSIAIASDGEIGALYGAFHFLRLLQTGQPIDRLDITERPKVQLRMLNHWDNIDGTIERGYAGRSLWQWNELPGTIESPLRRLRARQRLDRHQRRGHQQRQRRRAHPDAGVSAEGRRARRRCGGRTACGCTSRRTSPRRCASAA